MTFQQNLTYFFISSIASTLLFDRFCQVPLRSLFYPALIALLFVCQALTAIAANVWIWPRFSSIRHLPQAPQKPVFQRLFKEPCPWHFEAWTNTVPNDGLIRYYGILNIEKVLVTSPEAVKDILQTQVYSFRKQYHQRSYFERNQGYGLVIQEGNFHRHARKLIGHALGRPKVLTDYWPIIQRKVSEMLLVVQRAAQNKELLEIDELVQRTIFDVSGEVSYGMDFESVLEPQKHYEALGSYNAIFQGNSSTRLRLLLGFVLPKWAVDVLPIKYNQAATSGMRHFKSIGRSYMAKTTPEVAASQPVQSVMDELIASKQMDDRELWEQWIMMLPGALHNTLSGVVSVVWFLAQPRYAHVQHRLRQELQTFLATSHQNIDAVPLPTLEQIPYLRAVLNESLRLHPPASWFGREVASTPTLVNNTMLPPGLAVGFSPWALHRDIALYGPDASEFNPDRWLQPDMQGEHRAWLTFGAGPRRCVGEQLAKAELYCLIARLFAGYKVEFEGYETKMPPKVSHHVTVAYREAIRIRVTSLGGDVAEKVEG